MTPIEVDLRLKGRRERETKARQHKRPEIRAASLALLWFPRFEKWRQTVTSLRICVFSRILSL